MSAASGSSFISDRKYSRREKAPLKTEDSYARCRPSVSGTISPFPCTQKTNRRPPSRLRIFLPETYGWPWGSPTWNTSFDTMPTGRTLVFRNAIWKSACSMCRRFAIRTSSVSCQTQDTGFAKGRLPGPPSQHPDTTSPGNCGKIFPPPLQRKQMLIPKHICRMPFLQPPSGTSRWV